MRRRSGGQRGQALVATAVLLPVFLMMGTGAIELGNVYAQSLALARAADSAARALAERVSSSDLLSDPPPDWMRREAARLVSDALGGQAALDAADVLWGSLPRVTVNRGDGLSVEVPLPTFGTGRSTLVWGDPHSYSYLSPTYQMLWRSADFQPGVSYGEGAVYPGWQWANLTHGHGYGDSGAWSWWSQTIWGLATGPGYTWVWLCAKICIPVPIKVWVSGLGFSWQPFVGDAWVGSAGRTMGWNYEGAWIPADWASWWSRRTSTDAFRHWDRWLSESGFRWESGTTLPNRQSATVGPYAVYLGDSPYDTTAWPSNPNTVRRTIVVSATGRFRAATPVLGYIFEGRPFTRTAVRDVERRM